MKKYLLTILFCLITFPVWATTYYVDPDTGTNDSSHGTSQGSPWASIPGAVGDSGWFSGGGKLQNGDIVYVKGGITQTKRINITTTYYNGSSAYDSIRIISGHLAETPWGTGRAILDEGNTRTCGFDIQAVGITVDGFEVKNIAASTSGSSVGASCCVGFNSSYGKVRRCYLHHATRSGNDTGHGIETGGGGNYLIIEYNDVGPNIGTKGIEIWDTHKGVIRGNYVTTSGDHPIVISGQLWDVVGNMVIPDPVAAGNNNLFDNPQQSIKVTGQYIDLWNNVIFHTATNTAMVVNGISPGIGSGGSCGAACASGVSIKVYHNTVYDTGTTGNDGSVYDGMGLNSGFDSGGQATGNVFYNNISYHASAGSGGSRHGQFCLYSTGKGTIVDHNLLYGNADGQNVVAIGNTYPTYTVSSFQSTYASATNNLQSTPAFTGGTLPTGMDSSYHPNTSYFTLSASSPSESRTTSNTVIQSANQGYCPTQDASNCSSWYPSGNKFAYDILGNTRTNWSMGAYEYGAGGDTTPPSVTGCTISGGTYK